MEEFFEAISYMGLLLKNWLLWRDLSFHFIYHLCKIFASKSICVNYHICVLVILAQTIETLSLFDLFS
jgi:hypothetical protein